MTNCNETGYGKHCFTCEEAPKYIYLIATGAGMDREMLKELGDRRLAIKCPAQTGKYFVLNFTKAQIKEISGGALEMVTEEALAKKQITAKNIVQLLTEKPDEIETNVQGECLIPPPFP